MADPQQVLRILRYRGVTVRVDGDRLIATPRPRLDPELRRLIVRFRAELIAHLEAERRLAETVGSILALSPDELRQYRREVREASPDDPNLAHDRTALRRADAALASAQEQEVA